MLKNILTVGDHSFVQLYNWALSNSDGTGISNIYHYSKGLSKNKVLVKLNDLSIYSNGKNQIIHITDLKELKSSTTNFDLIIMNCNSLEAYSETLSELAENDLLLPTKTKIIIENTGSIPLDSFVNLSLPAAIKDSIDVYYSLNKVKFKPILNEKNEVEYELKTSETNEIMLSKLLKNGNSSHDQEMIKLMEKVFKPYQIEFTYEKDFNKFFNDMWKYSIHSIVIQSLMIIFELSSYKKLEKFILCKPLLKGLYQEMSKIYESQVTVHDADLKSLKSYFKWLFASEDSLITLDLIQFDLNLESKFDLNILYPILLADDLSIKIPYLEFLYSILQQLSNYRSNKSDNFISKRKYTSQLEALTVKLDNLEQQLNNKVNVLTEKIQVYETENGVLMQKNDNLNNENSSLKYQLEIQVSELQQRLQDEVLLKNDFLEQLTALKISQKTKPAEGKSYRKSLASQLQLTSGDEEDDFVDAKDTVSLSSPRIQAKISEIAAAGEPSTPAAKELRKSRSIQGVNAQFSSPMSNTEAGLDALKEVQMFSEYGIYYGTPEKHFSTNGTNSTDTAVAEKEDSLEPQTGLETEAYEDKTILGDNEVSRESLKQKQLELQKRELILEQKERMMMMGGNNMFQPPPKQQFPPIPRKSSFGNMNKHVQAPTAFRMSYMQQPQFVPDSSGFNGGPNASAPTPPSGYNGGQQQKLNLPKQQHVVYPPQQQIQQQQILQQQQLHQQQQILQQQQFNHVPAQGRSVSQPVQGSGTRMVSNGSGGQPFMPQMHHPQYIKTSRKNRSSVMLPSASKVSQNLNYDMLNSSGHKSSELLVNSAFDDFGPQSFNAMSQDGNMQVAMNSSQRMVPPKKPYQNLSKKSSFQDMNSAAGFGKGNILPPGFTAVSGGNNSGGNNSGVNPIGVNPVTGSAPAYVPSSLGGDSKTHIETGLKDGIVEENESALSQSQFSHDQQDLEHRYDDVNSDEFKLDSNSPQLRDQVTDLGSLGAAKNAGSKKPTKLSKLFGKRKISV